MKPAKLAKPVLFVSFPALYVGYIIIALNSDWLLAFPLLMTVGDYLMFTGLDFSLTSVF